MQIKKADLTKAALTPTIFTFCIPLIIGSLIQVMFNIADQAVLGHMAGGVAVASVGACSMVVGLVINFVSGLSGGVTIVLARALGEGDDERSRVILSTAVVSSVLLGILALCTALPLSGWLLNVTDCPDDCYRGALIYLRIYYCSAPSIVVYNFGSAILRVTGDSRRPTFYLVIAGVLNVILNITLCFLMEEKVAAVAIATFASQTLGAILVLLRLTRLGESYRFNIRKISFEIKTFGKIMRYGVPTGLNSSLFCLANLQIQAGINSYGSSAISGYTAAVNIDNILASVTSGFSQTTIAMVGQNLGAGNRKRVFGSIYYNLLYSVLITGVLSAILFSLHSELISLIVPGDPVALPYGYERMRAVTAWYALHAVNSVLSSTVNAFGYSIFSALSSFIGTIVFRPIWMKFVYEAHRSFRTIMTCFTVSWFIMFTVYLIAAVIILLRYRKGKLKKL